MRDALALSIAAPASVRTHQTIAEHAGSPAQLRRTAGIGHASTCNAGLAAMRPLALVETCASITILIPITAEIAPRVVLQRRQAGTPSAMPGFAILSATIPPPTDAETRALTPQRTRSTVDYAGFNVRAEPVATATAFRIARGCGVPLRALLIRQEARASIPIHAN
jgi:hypothetical protein